QCEFHSGGAGILGIRNHHMRAYPALLFEDAELWNESLSVYAHTRSDFHVVFDHRKCADAHIVADFVLFSDIRLVASLKVGANTVTGVDDYVGTNHGAIADDGFQLTRFAPHRRCAHDGEILDNAVLAQAHIGIHDRPFADHGSSPSRDSLGV